MQMTPQLAKRRYRLSLLGFSLGYAGTLIGVTIALKKLSVSTSGFALILAIFPGLFLFGMLWSVWRFMSEVDEVTRHFTVQSMMLGLFGILTLSGVWGVMELLVENLPQLPIFWIFPAFFLAFGLANCFGPGRGMGLK